ncbi:MAG: LysM peptidoglycan-binding domain-containing protein [Bacteroidota bacterium]
MRFVFILCSTIIVLSAMAAYPVLDSLRSEKREEGMFVIHEVEEEETLYSIAKRYKSSIDAIIMYNQIVDYRIEIGQIIEILLPEKTSLKSNETLSSKDQEGFHIVKQGETLYSISKNYKVKIRDLKKWNELENNAISPGMSLQVREQVSIVRRLETEEGNILKLKELNIEEIEADPFADFEKYLVQTGETLRSIAAKIGIHQDSLRYWNGLKTDYLEIGQALWFKNEGVEKEASLFESGTEKMVSIDEDGFERIYEEGIASVIESMNTSRYLALHRTLPIGTDLEVRNLMNNRIAHVKVVGKLPDTGLNKNLLLRLSKVAYDQLGILDAKSRVEVSYHKQ